jgi:hypothetical protein
MRPSLLKRTPNIDIFTKLNDFALTNCSNTMDKYSSFFRDMHQNREVISKVGNLKYLSPNQTAQQRHILTTYINEILVLRSKMLFGKESFNCTIDFEWTDTIKEKLYKSNNINFEYYNALFNLAVIYYVLGLEVGAKSNDDKNIKKDAITNFKKALCLFRIIKNEAYKSINQAELPIDLYPTHLEYCERMCIIAGQKYIVEVAEITSEKEYSLHAKLYCCIVDNYNKIYTLCNTSPTNQGGSSEFRNYLNNRLFFYKYLMYAKLRDAALKKFEKTGNGYGDALYFQGKGVQELLECQKNIQNCGNHVNLDNFYKTLNEEQLKGQDMLDKNDRIYHQQTPQPGSIKLEKKDLMIPILSDDLFIGENKKKFKDKYNQFCGGLDSLVPPLTKDMIQRFRVKISQYLQENINQYESEKTIMFFIQNLRLPRHLIERKKEGEKGSGKFPQQLWEKINKIQNLGGFLSLTGTMQNIMNKSQYLISNLQNTLNSFQKEEADDNYQRQRYKNDWVRKSSNEINIKFIGPIQNYIQNLQNTRQFDQKQNDDILNNVKNFEILGYTKAKLEADIPGDQKGLNKLSSDEEKIKNEINKLYELSDKCMEIINPIYEELNEDGIIMPTFIEVLAKKTTEEAVYKKYKEDYAQKFVKLNGLTEEVKKQKNVVNNLVQKIGPNLGNGNNYGLSEETMKYFKNIEQKINLFMNMYEKVKKGENYYNGLQHKIGEIIQASNKWMISRNEEKKVLIEAINKGHKKGGYISGPAPSFI